LTADQVDGMGDGQAVFQACLVAHVGRYRTWRPMLVGSHAQQRVMRLCACGRFWKKWSDVASPHASKISSGGLLFRDKRYDCDKFRSS
jgi:hypothetical protein